MFAEFRFICSSFLVVGGFVGRVVVVRVVRRGYYGGDYGFGRVLYVLRR